MTDYKDKYLRAVRALDETEREGHENVQDLYRTFITIIVEMKGHHREIDKAIQALPTKITGTVPPPIDELLRLKDLIVSYFNKADEGVPAADLLDSLLSNLKVSDALHERVGELQSDLLQANAQGDFIQIVKNISSLVLNHTEGGVVPTVSGNEIEDVKRSLLHSFEQLAKSDIALAKSINHLALIKELNKITSLSDLEHFYRKMIEGLAQRITRKDESAQDHSGLIETVVHQLSELSADIQLESQNSKEAQEDRWRLTELMGGDINTIQQSVLEAESLVTLKSLLNSRLGELNKRVVSFSELESKRALDAEKHVERMTMKLNTVESEVSNLKISLDQAHKQAFVDALTGISNRRAYDERMSVEFERWKRSGEPLVLAILDVDHFKNINDTFGHPIGDKVLRTICQLIDDKVRESDFFGRVGGEEFAIIFTGSGLANGMKRLNQFRESVERCKFGSKGKRIVITMSTGCALFTKDDTPESVYARADQALLKAKQTGRNKCLSEKDL